MVLKLPDCPPVATGLQLPPDEPELLLEEELELLLDELEALLEELDDELELDELLLEEELQPEPPTLSVKACVLCAPQLLVCTAVAVQEACAVTLCSRAAPEAPQPLQLQEPPVTGCGPNCTVLPAATLAAAVCCQVPPFTRR